MEKKGTRDTVRAAKIKLTAQIAGVSDRQVQRVLNAEQENETIVMAYMEIDHGLNKLVQEVKRIVPLT